jgi:hypothetical protein
MGTERMRSNVGNNFFDLIYFKIRYLTALLLNISATATVLKLQLIQ